MNVVQAARKSAGFTQDAAAAIIGCSSPTWAKRESNPESMTIGQFFTLYRELDTDAQSSMWGYLEGMRDGAKKFYAVD